MNRAILFMVILSAPALAQARSSQDLHACLGNDWSAAHLRSCVTKLDAPGAPGKQRAPREALLKYEVNLASAAGAYGSAQRANTCGLRSDAWLDTFATAYAMTEMPPDLSAEEAREAQSLATDVFRHNAAVDTYETTCREMVNGAMMDRLDRIEYRLRGGYH